jgi:hypothetical protein
LFCFVFWCVSVVVVLHCIFFSYYFCEAKMLAVFSCFLFASLKNLRLYLSCSPSVTHLYVSTLTVANQLYECLHVVISFFFL